MPCKCSLLCRKFDKVTISENYTIKMLIYFTVVYAFYNHTMHQIFIRFERDFSQIVPRFLNLDNGYGISCKD